MTDWTSYAFESADPPSVRRYDVAAGAADIAMRAAQSAPFDDILMRCRKLLELAEEIDRKIDEAS